MIYLNIEDIKKLEPLFGAWTVSGMIGEGTDSRIYRLQCVSGETVSNAVLKAVHIESGKNISPELLSSVGYASSLDYDDACLSVCRREAEAVMSLKGHPNVVKIYNYNIVPEPGSGFTLMLLCEQLKPLSDGINAESGDEATVKKLGKDICAALEAYASAGYCHGEIKPENIYVDAKGNFKLGDFGFCRILKTVTQRGSAGYMAPEVYSGDRPSYSSDIYSLGLLMYKFMNHNRVPFLPRFPDPISFADREIAFDSRMRAQTMPEPDQASPAMARAILKACAYNPAERYQSPGQFIKVISDIPDMKTDAPEDDYMTRFFVPVTDLADKDEEKTQTMEKPVHRPIPPENFTALSRAAQTGSTFGVQPPEAPESEQLLPEIEVEQEEEEEEPVKEKKKINGVVLAVIIIAAVLLLAAAVIFAKGTLFSKEEETTTVPTTTTEKVIVYNFVNSFYDNIKNDAEYTDKFVFEVQYAVNDARQGIIVDQSLTPGISVDKGTTVVLTVSSGPEKIMLQDVVGKPYNEAYELLKSSGFSVTSKTVENDRQHDEGIVAQMSLESDREYEKGTTVVLSVWGERPTEVTTTEETTTQPTTTEPTTTEPTTTEPTTTESQEPESTEFTTDELFDDEDREYYEVVNPSVSFVKKNGTLESVTLEISSIPGADPLPTKQAVIRSFLGNRMVQTIHCPISCTVSEDGETIICTLEIKDEDFEYDPANYKYFVSFQEGTIVTDTGTNYGFSVPL